MKDISKAAPASLNDPLPIQLGRQARAARIAKGLSIRAATVRLKCSPRFMLQLEQGKPTVRMDKVLQTLEGLGLQLGVRALEENGTGFVAPSNAQAEARARQNLHDERLARAHDRISARLALREVSPGDIEKARSQVRKWADQQICSPWYVDRWTALLAGSAREIASRILRLEKEDAKALFQNTPFGFLVREYLRA